MGLGEPTNSNCLSFSIIVRSPVSCLPEMTRWSVRCCVCRANVGSPMARDHILIRPKRCRLCFTQLNGLYTLAASRLCFSAMLNC